ncbi:stimulus-sensing domain-containing protein [Sneathiella limimaris]|uniref:stimulus-sensing domain-containing protein n=1 Tax=Sneathiella limimaris TaxID=1964213 RepID=UPI00146A26C0
MSDQSTDKPATVSLGDPVYSSESEKAAVGQNSSRSSGIRQKRRWWRFSSLSRRIMAINLFSIIFLAGGILYLDQFRAGLIEARLQALQTNGRMIAGALGEAALGEMSFTGGSNYFNLDSRNIRRVLRRMSVVTGIPAKLFDREGVLVADSRLLISSGREIILEALPPPDQRSRFQKIYEESYDFLAGLIPNSRDYPLFPTKHSLSADDFKEVQAAMTGEASGVIRQTEDGRLMLSVAMPVQGFKRILGALMLVENGDAIDEAVRSAQITTLTVFSITVIITLLLSLYLARTIASPVQEMAEAADKVRLGIGRRVDMPDFSNRQDEIGDLSVSYRQMTEALYDRMDAIEAFAADVSHELKNPLTSLGTAIDTFERVKDEATRQKLQEVISSDVKRLDRLITDISSASRLDAELSRTEGEIVNLVEVTDGVVGLYSGERARNNVTVEVEISTPEILIEGVPGRLGQVFRNLIENAISFSPENGRVLVRVHEEKDFKGQNWVQVDVEDQGPGIPENKLEAIFSRFYTERPKSEGFGNHSGLGLSISRLIVEAHGGTILASNRMSSEGKIIGAKFTVRLPK